MSILNNRERSFKVALESVRITTDKLIARLELDLHADDLSDEEFSTESEKAGSTEDLLVDFDDAVEMMAIERNSYVSESEIELGGMEVKLKES